MSEIASANDLSNKGINVSGLNAMELIMLHNYIKGLADQTVFGLNQEGKNVVRAKLKEVEKELLTTVFGCNPFKLGAITIEGETPEKIDLSKFDSAAQAKTFVVAEVKK